MTRDILDVEGFKVDELKCWRYIMIVSFIASDLVLLNRDGRTESIGVVMNIIHKSFKKMEENGIPRILKNILIPVNMRKKFIEFNLDKTLELWKLKKVICFSIFINFKN